MRQRKTLRSKLEMGLRALGLHSNRNLGLLLHLLGLKVPDGALIGLDGLLIGLRTRELLQQLLEARCRLSPVVMIIEDLHWIDSVSEELLGKIIDSEAKLRLSASHHAAAGILATLARPHDCHQVTSGTASDWRHSPPHPSAARRRGSAGVIRVAGGRESRGQSALRRGDCQLS